MCKIKKERFLKGTPPDRKLAKNCNKPIDKIKKICYNIYVS